MGLLLFLTGCHLAGEREYYSHVENYIADEAVVDSIKFSEDPEYIKLKLSGIDDRYQDNDFIIKGKSVAIVIEKGIFEQIHVGDRIQYTSAPAYFGNSYCMPIVELSVEGIVILSFEDGYRNLLELY